MEDRRYGLWIVARAKKYGYGFEGEAVDQSQRSAAIDKKMADCYLEESARLEPLQAPELRGDPTVARRLEAEASALARATPDWKAVKDDWWGCLEANGLTRADDDGWSSKQGLEITSALSEKPRDAAISERAIRIAIVEAQCNVTVSMTQRLGDIEASFQEPLVEKNRSALEKEKEANQSAVRIARDIRQRG